MTKIGTFFEEKDVKTYEVEEGTHDLTTVKSRTHTTANQMNRSHSHHK
jgi:hypothetical protein